MKTDEQGELLFNRLVKRYRHLKKWAKRTGTGAFRLYDLDIPEIPLVLDFYGGAVSGALYRRPYEKEEAEEERWLLAMKASIARALDIGENVIFLKERRRLRQRREKGNQYEKMSAGHFFRDVTEGDLVFRANLSDYLDTGLFLDARKKRALIRGEAGDKRVLNLFAYTCSLSAAAAKGGARRVDSVDLSNTYLDWGRVNFALNRLPAPDIVPAGAVFDNGRFQGRNNLIRGDVFAFIDYAAEKKIRWDLILLDPPSFSNSKKMRGTLDIRRDYAALVKRSLSLLAPDGTLYFSSNARGFNFDSGNFPNFTVTDISANLVDEDFKGKKFPVCRALTAKPLP